MIITDFRILDNLQVISESKSDGTMKIRGLFQRANEVNQNKRRYPKKILEASIKKLKPFMESKRLFGELDHPPYEEVKLSNASHIITKMEMRGNDVIGEATLLSTPAGLIAQAIIKGGGQLGISSRGTGTMTEAKDGVLEVNEDYNMRTLDLVADPSVSDALPSVYESKMNEQTKIVSDAVKKVYSEKIFVKLLESKLTAKFKKDTPEDKAPLDSYTTTTVDTKVGSKLGKNKKLAKAPGGYSGDSDGDKGGSSVAEKVKTVSLNRENAVNMLLSKQKR